LLEEKIGILYDPTTESPIYKAFNSSTAEDLAQILTGYITDNGIDFEGAKVELKDLGISDDSVEAILSIFKDTVA
jgi:hypothetical protein